MTGPTPAERAALKTAHAAAASPDGGYDLVSAVVFALGSAQLLQSPETAAEHKQVRADRDKFADRVDTLTSVAKGNKRHVRELTKQLMDAEKRLTEQGGEVEKLVRWRREDSAEMERLRKQVAELKAERHTTNDALAEVTVAHRAVTAPSEEPVCAFRNPHEPHTNEPGTAREWQCPGVPAEAVKAGGDS